MSQTAKQKAASALKSKSSNPTSRGKKVEPIADLDVVEAEMIELLDSSAGAFTFVKLIEGTIKAVHTLPSATVVKTVKDIAKRWNLTDIGKADKKSPTSIANRLGELDTIVKHSAKLVDVVSLARKHAKSIQAKRDKFLKEAQDTNDDNIGKTPKGFVNKYRAPKVEHIITKIASDANSSKDDKIIKTIADVKLANLETLYPSEAKTRDVTQDALNKRLQSVIDDVKTFKLKFDPGMAALIAIAVK
jgi:hypothetical protein